MVDNVQYYNRYWNDCRSKNNHKINPKVKIWHQRPYSGIIFSLFCHNSLMAGKRGGIGALGSAQARFFHPSAKIREKWPNDHKRLRLKRVVVTGKEMFRISRRDQLAYKCCIAKIDDGSEFHICANNFQVDQDPVLPFKDESMKTPCTHPVAEPDLNKEARGSNENASNNIGRGANQEEWFWVI